MRIGVLDVLGSLLAIYTGWSIWCGGVHAKRGMGMQRLSRAQEPVDFWTVIVIYAGLSIAMIAWS